MAETRTVTLELDAGTLDFIEREVAAGRFADTHAFLQLAVDRAIKDSLFEEIDEASPEFETWIAEGLAEDARFDSEEADWVTVGQLRENLDRRRVERAQAALRVAE